MELTFEISVSRLRSLSLTEVLEALRAGCVSFNPRNPITNVKKERIPETRQGRKYGCSLKRVILPKIFGHLLAGLLKTPPIIGATVVPALHIRGIMAKASPILVESDSSTMTVFETPMLPLKTPCMHLDQTIGQKDVEYPNLIIANARPRGPSSRIGLLPKRSDNHPQWKTVTASAKKKADSMTPA